jgi:hypothetical protein
MGPPYSAWADWLDKFHTSSDWIQALWLVSGSLTALGVTWLVMRAIRDIVCAVLMRNARKSTLGMLRQDPQRRVPAYAQEEPARIEEHRPFTILSRHGRT